MVRHDARARRLTMTRLGMGHEADAHSERSEESPQTGGVYASVGLMGCFTCVQHERGGAPLFEIYDDRITVVSYGGLVGGLTQEEFFSGRSMPRNRELMRVFRDMEFVENFGSGIQRILRVYDRSIFQISDNFIITEFQYDPEVLKKVRNAIVHGEPVNEPVKLTATAQRVLALAGYWKVLK